MNLREFFQPDLGAFLRYVVGFSARYALLCGGLFFLLHRWAGPRLRAFKIQPAQPPPELIRHEIFWSASNTLCTGLFTLLLYWVIDRGHSSMYFSVDEHGWGWLCASVLLGILGFDTWFYFLHRTLHTPWLFRHAHAIHHRMVNPTPFASFSHHPIETFSEDAYFLLLVMFVPLHPYAMALVGLHAFALAIMGHMGFEFFPDGFTRHWLLGLHNTSTHHNMHHSHPGCNYGLYFNWWDRIMGTNHASYHEYFDAVKARSKSPQAVA